MAKKKTSHNRPSENQTHPSLTHNNDSTLLQNDDLQIVDMLVDAENARAPETLGTDGTSASDVFPSSIARRRPTGLAQRPNNRHFSSTLPMRGIRLDNTSALTFRRVSQTHSVRSAPSTHYPLLWETLSPDNRSDAFLRPPPPAGSSSYAQSLTSQSSHESHQSVIIASDTDRPPSQLDSMLADVPDDDPYVLQVLNLSTQHYRDKLKDGQDMSKGAHPPVVTAVSATASRRPTISSTQNSSSPTTSTHRLSTSRPTSESTIPSDPVDTDQEIPPPDPEFNPSSETLYRSTRCKQYLETRYSHIALLSSAEGLRYNPLEVIRWRRAMWQRAVQSGASSEEQKKWKLRYYTWHVGNTELVEYYNENKGEKGDMLENSGSEQLDIDHDIDIGGPGSSVSRWKRRKRLVASNTDDRIARRGSARRSFRPEKGPGSRPPLPADSLLLPERFSPFGYLNSSSPVTETPPLLAVEGTVVATPAFLTQFLTGTMPGAESITPDKVTAQSDANSNSRVGPTVGNDSEAENRPSAPTLTGTALRPGESGILSADQELVDSENTQKKDEVDPRNQADGTLRKRKKSHFWGRIMEKRSYDDGESAGSTKDLVPNTVLASRKKSFLNNVAIDHFASKIRKPSNVALTDGIRTSMDSQRSTMSSGRDALDLERKSKTENALGAASAKGDPDVRQGSAVRGSADETSLSSKARQNGYESPSGLIEFEKGKGGSAAEDFVNETLEVGITDARVVQHLYIDDNVGSETDDGLSRTRRRGIKGMMKSMRRRGRKEISGEHGVNVEKIQSDIDTGAEGWLDSDGGRAGRKGNRLDVDREYSRKWMWDSSSSESGSESALGQTRERSRDQWWGRNKGKKGKPDATPDKQSLKAEVAEIPEVPKKVRRRQKLMRTLMGNRPGNDSSASLNSSYVDDGVEGKLRTRTSLENVSIVQEGAQATLRLTSGDELGSKDEHAISPDTANPTIQSDTGSSAGVSTSITSQRIRDPQSAFTAEEAKLHNDLSMLMERLDVIMPTVEQLRTDIQYQVDQQKNLISQVTRRISSASSHATRTSATDTALSSTSNTVTKAISHLQESQSATHSPPLVDGSDRFVTPDSSPTPGTPNQDVEQSLMDSSQVGLNAKMIRTTAERIQHALEELEQRCKLIAERDVSSHERIRVMVSELDAVTQQVNEDLSRRLKVIEEVMQQSEGHPRAFDYLQEFYYQLIAYLLAFLGFTLWSWFQLWKAGKRTLNGARGAINLITPGRIGGTTHTQ